MKGYQTEQRKLLISFFTKNPDQQFTISEISERIPDISISAIYRNINSMVTDGALQRFQMEGSRQFLYQYIGGTCSEHIHLKCNQCGKIVHMDTQSVQAVLDVVKKTTHFNIDKSKTILFGSCKSCEYRQSTL